MIGVLAFREAARHHHFAMPPVTWSCPNCGRRVPLRISQCHCGTTREDADRLATAGGPVPGPGPGPGPGPRGGPAPPRARRFGPPLRIGPLSWDLKALLVAIVVVVVLGIASLFFWPRKPEKIVPVLGYANSQPPTPSPSPTAAPKGWKLPWKK